MFAVFDSAVSSAPTMASTDDVSAPSIQTSVTTQMVSLDPGSEGNPDGQAKLRQGRGKCEQPLFSNSRTSRTVSSAISVVCDCGALLFLVFATVAHFCSVKVFPNSWESKITL
ncbi:hypothetical protein BASA83_004338 [Batrachochytrium salamandrivorans]|nr:hypothetical protein BASA83_004338 [Batrachochytrium salamandrivorans]